LINKLVDLLDVLNQKLLSKSKLTLTLKPFHLTVGFFVI
jgi:hypothetical protein